MRQTLNPLLLQVLHRRRMLRGVRWTTTAWVVFGGLHIAVWWFAFDHTPDGWPRGLLGAAVWPLLLVATASFVALVIYAARWLLAPSDSWAYDFFEQLSTKAGAADAVDPEDENETTGIRLRTSSGPV